MACLPPSSVVVFRGHNRDWRWLRHPRERLTSIAACEKSRFRLAGSEAERPRGRRRPSAHDVEREAQRAPALDEVRDGVPVDEIGERLRENGRQAKAPKLLCAPGANGHCFPIASIQAL